MSTCTVDVTVGFATVAVITPSASLNDGSPPHANETSVRAQPLSARYGLLRVHVGDDPLAIGCRAGQRDRPALDRQRAAGGDEALERGVAVAALDGVREPFARPGVRARHESPERGRVRRNVEGRHAGGLPTAHQRAVARAGAGPLGRGLLPWRLPYPGRARVLPACAH